MTQDVASPQESDTMTDQHAPEEKHGLSDSFKKLGEKSESTSNIDSVSNEGSPSVEAQDTVANISESLNTKNLEELTALKEEVNDLKDQNLRTLAEMQNLRQRNEKDVADARKFGMTGFARDMISVLENITRAEESISAEEIENNELIQKIMEGIRLTREELLKTFEQNGIKQIVPEGETFDHNFHQAIVQIPDSDNPPNTVIQVMQPGYVIHDRLLRPAMVGVSTTPPQAD